MVEVWKDIVGYEGKYQVSNIGRVKSLKDNHGNYREKILRSRADKYGYLYVSLCKGGKVKTYKVHRLVAIAFVDGYFEGAVVNHKDECKDNNAWTNLEWCSYEYNNTYNDRHKRAGDKNKGRNHTEESKKKMSEKKKGKYKGNENPRAKKVMCLETGEVFTTVKEAEEFINVSRSAITQAIKRNGSCKGLHWRYVD